MFTRIEGLAYNMAAAWSQAQIPYRLLADKEQLGYHLVDV
jgi:hypothetical protein